MLRSSPRARVAGVDRPSIGRYALLSKLGEGGMGVVYHAAHVTLGSEVAIKIMPRGAAGAEEELLARFRREAQLAAQLRSPHLVSVLDIAEDPPSGCHFIVMEYVHGLSAAGWAKKLGGRAPEADALDVCIAATRGLVAAHLQGVVHRDLKPANILVPSDRDGRPQLADAKLADLGLARSDASADGVTRTGMMMGTPGYMAPEQAKSARRAKKPADVLAMGATLYKLLTGRAPFLDPATGEWLEWTFLGKHLPASQLRPDLSAATVALLESALAAAPESRYPDASALLEALDACRRALVAPAADATTAIHAVRSLVTRSEQGLPVQTDPSSERVADPSATLETAPTPVDPPPREPVPQLRGAPASQERPPAPTGSPGHPTSLAQPAPPAEEPSPTSPYRRPAPLGAGGTDPARRRSRPAVLGIALLLFAIAAAALWRPWESSGAGGEEDPPVAPPSSPGLFVESTPPGAAVAVDGVERGRTPLLVPDLAEGGHAVRVTLDDHDPWSSVEVRTRMGERTPLAVELPRSLGTVRASGGAPGAQVVLTRQGDPPKSYAFELDAAGALAGQPVEAGTYALVADSQGWTPHQGTVRVRGGAEAPVVLAMSALPAAVSVTSAPPGARVRIDGAEVGTTPLSEVSVTPGRHEVVVDLPRHAPARLNVDFAPGQRRTLEPFVLRAWGTVRFTGFDRDVTATVGGSPLADGAPLAPGPVDVVLARPRHAPQTVRIDVPLGGRATLSPEPWERYQARIDLTALGAGVTATVDRQPQSGVVGFAEAGRHRVELALADHEPQVQDVSVALGRTERIRPAGWVPLPGRLDLSALPRDVVVKVDGRTVAVGSSLAAGDHEVVLERPGFVTQGPRTVTAQPNRPLHITAETWVADKPALGWADARLLLTDLSRWKAATPADRRSTADLVAQRTPGFTLKGLETFSGGGQSYEIAVFTHGKTGLEFSLVPGGRFQMGSPAGETDRDTDEDQHDVTIRQPFLICRTEVTQAAWDRIGGEDQRKWTGASLPIEGVSWEEVRAWCGKAGDGLRLPSEAEWEYACRAGTTTAYWSGASESDLGRVGWYSGNSSTRTHDVAQKPANSFGLHDVHGNVWEWCEDGYESDYAKCPTDGSAHPPQASEFRVLRGGSWDSPARGARSAIRLWLTPGFRYTSLGFRPARSVPTD